MRRALRWFSWFLLALLLILVALLMLLRLQPQLALGAVNALQDGVALDSPDLALELWPLRVTAGTLEAVTATQQLDLVGLDARLDPAKWWRQRTFWQVELDSLRVAQTGAVTESAGGPAAMVDLRPYLTFDALRIGTLTVEGDSPLALSLTATQQEAKIDLALSVTLPEHALTVDGVIEPTADALKAVLRYDLQPRTDAQLTASGEISGALRVTEAASLAIEGGDGTVMIDGATHRLVLDEGTLVFGPSAAIDEITVTALRGRYETPDWSAPLPFDISARLQDLNGDPGYRLQTSLAEARLETEGRWQSEAATASGTLRLAAQAPHPDIPLTPFAAADLFPLSMNATYTAGASGLSLSEWSFDSPRNRWQGDLALASAPALKIQGTIAAQSLYLPLVGDSETGEPVSDAPPEDIAADSMETAAGQEETAPRVFSDEAIDWAWLETADVALTLTAQTLALQDATFEDLRVALNSTSAGLELAPLSAVFGGGGFDGSVKLERAAQVPVTDESEAAEAQAPAAPGASIALDFELDGVALEAFGVVPKEELTGGELEVDVQLATRGASTAALAAGLGGTITVIAEDAQLMNDMIELAGSDLVMETLSKLNPFVRKDPTTKLVCALAHFDVEQGVLATKNELVLETSKMEIVGNGNVDLGTEKIALTLSPNAKSGVGVNVGSLVKFLKLGGTLAAPRPAADAAGLLKSGAAIGAAVSTGGISILAEGLAKRALNAGSACVRFRNRRDEPAAPAPDPAPDNATG